MAVKDNPPRVMRIMHLHLSADFERIWTNLHECWTTEAVNINWYVVIQDILSTNERLHQIRLVDSPLCGHCGEPDTIQHIVTACGEGARIWLWTKRRIAWILCIDPAHIRRNWTRRTQFRLWPHQRHRAMLWILAQIVWYRIKKSSRHWARLQRLSAKDTLEGVSGQTSPDQCWELSWDPMSTIPQEGHTVRRQLRGDSCYST